MTTAAPSWLTWPALVAITIIVLARYRWFNTTRMEVFFNNALATMLVSNLLRESAIQTLLEHHGVMTISTARLLSLAVTILGAGEFIAFVAVWAHPEKYTASYHNLLNRCLSVALAIAFMVAAEPARRAGQTLEDFGGWSSILAWALLITNLVVLAFQILRISITELVRGGLKPRERMVTVAGIGIGLAIGASSINALVTAILGEFGLVDSASILTWIHSRCIFYETVATAAIAAVPLAMAASGALALDGTSRRWRALQPLRRDLAAVVPATTFQIENPRRRKSALELHQTNVAIRDSILLLLPHFRDVEPARVAQFHHRFTIHQGRQRFYAEQALRLADALTARAAGDPPANVEGARMPVLKRSADLEDEAAELLRLARWWERALESAHAQRHAGAIATGTAAAVESSPLPAHVGPENCPTSTATMTHVKVEI